jgi:hypothetical protein
MLDRFRQTNIKILIIYTFEFKKNKPRHWPPIGSDGVFFNPLTPLILIRTNHPLDIGGWQPF